MIAASFTAQALESTLKLWSRAFGLAVECRFTPCESLVQTLLDPDGPVSANAGGVNVVLTRPEDLADEDGMRQLLEAIDHFGLTHAGQQQLLVGTLPPLVSAHATQDPRQTHALRSQWRTHLEAVPGVELFEFARTVEYLGVDLARDTHGDVLARAPYSARLYQELAIQSTPRLAGIAPRSSQGDRRGRRQYAVGRCCRRRRLARDCSSAKTVRAGHSSCSSTR